VASGTLCAVTTMTSVNITKRPDPIILTESAQTKVAALLAQESAESPLVLRVAVRPGGCSGYSYEMFFDPETAEDDVVRTYGDVTVAVDAASAPLLKGSTLDYTDSLNDAGFHIQNPNASRTCGCGSSFS